MNEQIIYCIAIFKTGETYTAVWSGVSTAMIGYGDTPDEAFYDLLECTAEWGLEDKGRDYPPSWRQVWAWNIRDWLHGLVWRFLP